MALSAVEREAWRTDGYFVTRGLFSPVQLAVLRGEAERLLAAADAELRLVAVGLGRIVALYYR